MSSIKTLQPISRVSQVKPGSRLHKIHKIQSSHCKMLHYSYSNRKTISVESGVQYESIYKNKVCPYGNFLREINIKLPSPKQKFIQFMKIAPFNRLTNHFNLITHFLRTYEFFKMHKVQLIQQFSKKVMLLQQPELNDRLLLVIESGECIYKKSLIRSGQIVNRDQLDLTMLQYNINTRFIALNLHDYTTFITNYLTKNLQHYQTFISNLQILKIFTPKSIQKFNTTLSLYFIMKGQNLYKYGDQANQLYIVYTGKLSRKVIVQIDQTNSIPVRKYQRVIRIMSRSYENKIEFMREDLVGVNQVIERSKIHKEVLTAEQNCILIGIERNSIDQILDQYIIDRLKKYNLKKYPVNYEVMCENYLKKKIQRKKQQQRKISALKGELDSNLPEKRKQKINNIIKIYQGKIKSSQKEHLLGGRASQRIINHN